jgi:hypothetical protein
LSTATARSSGGAPPEWLGGFIDLGDNRVIALLRQLGRIKGSGNRIEQPIGNIAEIYDGKLTKVHVYFSWEAALEVAGLSE